jgi:Protein of unknown function (DUF2568)
VALLASLNHALRFLLELCALAALGYGGFEAGGGTIVKVVLAIVLPLAAAVLWGVFVAPRAPVRPPAAVRLALELVVLLAAYEALAATGHMLAASLFASVCVVNAVLLRVLGRSAAVHRHHSA